MGDIGRGIGEALRFLLVLALAGVGAFIALALAIFGASGAWLLLLPAAGWVAGMILSRTLLKD